jgi:hypothetical protein
MIGRCLVEINDNRRHHGHHGGRRSDRHRGRRRGRRRGRDRRHDRRRGRRGRHSRDLRSCHSRRSSFPPKQKQKYYFFPWNRASLCNTNIRR